MFNIDIGLGIRETTLETMHKIPYKDTITL